MIQSHAEAHGMERTQTIRRNLPKYRTKVTGRVGSRYLMFVKVVCRGLDCDITERMKEREKGREGGAEQEGEGFESATEPAGRPGDKDPSLACFFFISSLSRRALLAHPEPVSVIAMDSVKSSCLFLSDTQSAQNPVWKCAFKRAHE